MGIVSLEGLEFFAYHGFYDEEQRIGNKYAVDIHIEADLMEAARADRLKATINYETIYQVIAEVMQERHRLLEHVAYRIIEKVKVEFPHIFSVQVNVSKYNPPIGGVCERAKVSIKSS